MTHQTIQIVNASDVRARVEALKKREDDLKARLAPCLKGLWNPDRIAMTGAEETVFDELLTRFPNFAAVIRYWKAVAVASRITGTIFRTQPVLLDGHPGLGKTYFASEAAKAMQLYFHEIPMSSITAGFVISGLSVGWGTGTPGEVAKALSKSEVANPMITLDEIEKSHGDGRHSPLGPLFPLLETHSARRFKDEALEIEIDASNINWVLTANNHELIPAPILSRVKHYVIPVPTEEQMVPILHSIYQGLRESDQTFAWLDGELTPDVVGELVRLTPRDARNCIKEAAIYAVGDRRKSLRVSDLVIIRKPESKRYGFH